MSRHADDRAAAPRTGQAGEERHALRARLLDGGLDADEARQIVERHGWRPAALALRSPRCPAAHRRLLESTIAERASRMPDGEAIALSRIATEPVLRMIAARRAPRVIAAVLASPRATEAVAAIVRERRDLTLAARRALLASSRFAGPTPPDEGGSAR